ncbi:hypothetical protein [Carboxylicivirga linearis]|uniref:Uncharacterized protein n=1 Tax=Carboxylicivirga linearis TaxID=1628157 RepID=A0ABS5JW20_9BACT|nr:hypothetical protein [Carboxylicivirga linearis]MBS2098671.1 hypothetical protein [Carboxylicivirga linearis]
MKRNIALAIIFVVSFITVRSQESLVLRTDRDFYIGGEDMWVNVVNLNSESNQPSDLSKVVYLELLNNEHQPVLQQKLRLQDGQVKSVVSLPDTISTANYALRVYTRWMRNLDVKPYTYKTISVINPFAKNSLPAVAESDISTKKQINSKYEEDGNFIQVDVKKVFYGNRDNVKLSLSKTLQEDVNHVTVSVVKSCLIKGLNTNSLSSFNKKQSVVKGDDLLLPEVEGELITGTITDLENGELITGEKMTLNFVGDSPLMQFSTTDSLGRFRFVVNEFGQREMVIQPFNLDTSSINYKVNLDPSFSEDYPEKMIEPLNLSKEKVEELNRAIINMQINTIYSAYREDGSGKDSLQKQPPFYGKAEILVPIGRFINLPTVEEVIKEIVPYVGLRKQKGEYFFKTFEPKSYYPRDGKTLTLVDGIPVHNINRVLEINPEELDHIEVINLDYFLEEEKLGRLLCFYSIENNMAAMDFDNRIFRQARECYHPSYTYVSPDYSSKEKRKNRLADFRNVLYFGNVDIVDEETEVVFYTGDDTGEYTVIVEGINSKGEVLRTTSEFTVR